jgi:hypothetical protein
MRRRALSVIVLALGLLGVACGSGDAPAAIVRPAAVPAGIVPATVAGDLTLHEFAPARATFARAGATSLVADGRVWAIRRGETLVGTLQVSTVKPDVSVTDHDDRAALIGGVMTGISYETIDVGSTQVIASTAADKSLYMWFGPNFFQVLQVKSTKVDPDTVAADLIEYQQAAGKLDRAAPKAKAP